MILRSLNILLAVVAAVGAIAWTFSYLAPLAPRVVRSTPVRAMFLCSHNGRVIIWNQEIVPPPPPGCQATLTYPLAGRVSWQTASSMSTMTCGFSDWGSGSSDWRPHQESRGILSTGNGRFSFRIVLDAVIIPWWWLACVGIVPAAMLVLPWHRRRRRARAGQCVVCGYDMRATPDRCPECGTKVA